MLKNNKMRVIKATYGGVDCTNQVQEKLRNNSLVVRADNFIIGDPSPGIEKTLELDLEINGENKHFTVKEHTLFSLAENGFKEKLGIFYSNNNDVSLHPSIRISLNSIKKASENKADIITCMWVPESSNPFIEYLAWTKTTSHLNQLLQIMQLLYVAKKVNPNYKYVSFLEHDVLYPEGYFDYPDFSEGEIMTNMNYIGMNKKGYQMRSANHEPFHEMTMHFSDAIHHCESILENALITNSGLIEPQNMKRLQWECPHPSVHMNHGKHFTSHFSIYVPHYEYKEHDYWGNHSQYEHVFNV